MSAFILPNHNIVGKSKIDKAIMKSRDWISAKENADLKAAKSIIGLKWSNKKLSEFEDLLKSIDNPILLTVPSSSRKNVLPIALAQKLYTETGIPFAIGDKHFDAIHNKQSKHLPRFERAFHPREYIPVDTGQLKKLFHGKNIIIVDDILTSGGSVKQLIKTLTDHDIKTKSVVALMGERRLEVDQKSIARLKQALKKQKINLSATALAQCLTRAEIGTIIIKINNARSENARNKVTGKLQGILQKGNFKDLGGIAISWGDKSSERVDKGDESISERVQTGPTSDRDSGRFKIEVTLGKNEVYKTIINVPRTIKGDEKNKHLENKTKSFLRILKPDNQKGIKIKITKIINKTYQKTNELER
ncbi:MAG: phosphoribosyltransferase [Deltaproteobacteria bacterium]|nr:phosphoribosyltransferase [Deltaproteobacteria bacterium]